MYKDSHKTAQRLLGSTLVRVWRGREISLVVNEVEVYDGRDDLASHAARGETKRNFVMFGHPGQWYVYLCYGVHWMLNLVTREKGYPAAILIRGGVTKDGKKYDGPGKLTKYLKIDKKLNATKADKKNGLYIKWRTKPLRGKVYTTPRIGVDAGGPIWSKKHFRYVVEFEK